MSLWHSWFNLYFLWVIPKGNFELWFVYKFHVSSHSVRIYCTNNRERQTVITLNWVSVPYDRIVRLQLACVGCRAASQGCGYPCCLRKLKNERFNILRRCPIVQFTEQLNLRHSHSSNKQRYAIKTPIKITEWILNIRTCVYTEQTLNLLPRFYGCQASKPKVWFAKRKLHSVPVDTKSQVRMILVWADWTRTQNNALYNLTFLSGANFNHNYLGSLFLDTRGLQRCKRSFELSPYPGSICRSRSLPRPRYSVRTAL